MRHRRICVSSYVRHAARAAACQYSTVRRDANTCEMAASAANFVRIIEEYPCLYNNKLAEYSRKDVTEKAWSEVAQKTNMSGE